VIDRRAGVPVTLGILYLHMARAAGWPAAGVAFPGQFLVRIEGSEGHTLVDPFDEGREMELADLYSLLHRAMGRMARLEESHLEPVPDETVLLRVLSNMKAVAMRRQELSRALELLDRMLILAPNEAAFLYEQAQILSHEGRPMAAKRKFEAVIALDPESPFAERSFEDLAGIKRQLN
jgi:regulator of sirC expression with transglutaminase-like and TPR domain